MSLFDLNGVQQNAIGRREHWRLFPPFQERLLYPAIIEELDAFIDEEVESIYASQLGSKILSKLQAQSPALFEQENREQNGPLFGMTLWHYLAQHPDDWRFVRQANEFDDPQGMNYFRLSR